MTEFYQQADYDPGEGPSEAPQGLYESRKLSPSEIITDILQDFGANLLLHAAMVRTTAPITNDLLEKALRRLIHFQPALRMTIQKDTVNMKNLRRARFAEKYEVDFEFATTSRRGRYGWVEVAQEELKIPFVTKRALLWKVIYVKVDADSAPPPPPHHYTPDSTPEVLGCLLFKMHPSIADHLCMYDLVCGQLLTIINSILMGRKDYLHEHFGSSLLMCDSADQTLLGADKGGKKKVKKKVQFDPGDATNSPEKCLFSKPVMWEEGETTGARMRNGTQLITFHLPRKVTMRVVDECKRRGVHMSTALMYAVNLAIGIYCKLKEGERKKRVTICTPVELRMYTDMNVPLTLGRFVSHQVWKLESYAKFLETETFWSTIESLERYYKWSKKECQAELNLHAELVDHIASGGPFDDITTPFRAHAQFYYLGDVETNKKAAEAIGDPVIATEHYFTHSHTDASFAPLAINMCIMNERLMGTISYDKKWLTKKFVTSFEDVFFDVIFRVMDPQGSEDYDRTSMPAWLRAKKERREEMRY